MFEATENGNMILSTINIKASSWKLEQLLMLRPFPMILTLRLAIEFVVILTFFPDCILSKRVSRTNTYPQPLHGVDRDPFVENAPLVIAVACRDGVAIVAATEPSSSSIQRQQQLKLNQSIIDNEPLMYYNLNEIKGMLQKTVSYPICNIGRSPFDNMFCKLWMES
jgi:hypothetical protein